MTVGDTGLPPIASPTSPGLYAFERTSCGCPSKRVTSC